MYIIIHFRLSCDLIPKTFFARICATFRHVTNRINLVSWTTPTDPTLSSLSPAHAASSMKDHLSRTPEKHRERIVHMVNKLRPVERSFATKIDNVGGVYNLQGYCSPIIVGVATCVHPLLFLVTFLSISFRPSQTGSPHNYSLSPDSS